MLNRHHLISIRLLSFALLTCVAAGSFAASTPPPDYRFKIETLIEGVPQPMQFQHLPDGRILFSEIAGKLKILDPTTRVVVEVGALEVTNAQENGLLGMALDPAFAKNNWVYLLHSPKDYIGQIISRFTITGDKLDLASRKDLLKWEEQREQCCHHAGALRFGPDGCLYVSTGDNTNPFASDGFSPHDDRPGRSPWDAQKSSANTNDLRGKILRIRPKADGTYEIPAGNLFAPGTPMTKPEIFAMGFRNPWRFNIDQKTGIVYVGDVGPDSSQNKETRGPNGFDTINQIRKPGYFGWPYARGKATYVAYDFESKASGVAFDPEKPLNKSAYNTGLNQLPPVQSPLIWYPAGESKDFPSLGKGGRTACAGPVFHYNPQLADKGSLPAHFDNCLLIYDWQRPFIQWARLDGESNLVGLEPFTDAIRVAQGDDDGSGRVQVRRPVDAELGPDGALYLFDYGDTWGANKDSRLLRISYQTGNLAPIAKVKASTTAGREPLTVDLSSEGSRDFEGDAISYEWRLHPADKIISKEPNAQVTLAVPGSYRVELRVSDAKGATGAASVAVMAGNTVPTVEFVQPQSGDFYVPGQTIKYAIRVQDVEDGSSDAKPDEFGFRTLTSAAWLDRDGKKADAAPGFTLMKQSDCFNCHAMDQKLVGPTLLEVANRYRGQAGAELTTVQRIIKGSTGVWGQVGMLPHPQHSEDEVHLMVRWIFGLESGKGSPGLARGLAGEIAVPKDDKSGGCVIEAVHTDAGRLPAATLSGKATVWLRPRRLEAEAAEEVHGPKGGGNGSPRGKALSSIAHGHYIRYSPINLSTTSGFTIRATSGGSGGKVEVRAGSLTGELLGEIDVAPTGGWDKWVELKAPLKVPAQARGDVYVLFVNPGKGGLMNLDWVQFDPAR